MRYEKHVISGFYDLEAHVQVGDAGGGGRAEEDGVRFIVLRTRIDDKSIQSLLRAS